MTTTLKTYPKYKESSLEWTAGIPSDWEKRRFKFIFNLIKRPINIDDEIITAFRDGMVTLRRNRKEEGFTIAIKEIGYQGVRSGDLVISGMDGFAGAIGISDSDGKATPVYSICKPIQKSIFPSYYKYLLRVLALSGYISILARGIRERSTEFKWNIIGNLLLVVPNFETQKNIADFLDEKTKVIDELVKKKEKMIELLREKRSSLITQVVTKGLDQKAKMKPSGIDWLGDIPETWEIDKITSLFIFPNEKVSDKDYEPLSVTYRGVERQVEGALKTENGDNRKLLKKGDIAFNGRSDRRGACGISEFTGSMSVVYHVLRKRSPKVLMKYFHHLFRNDLFSQEFFKWGRGIHYDMWSTKIMEMKKIQVPIPSIKEQEIIAKYLDTKINTINNTALNIQSQIEQLKEYRSSLIYSAVTGKIKV